MVTRNCSVMRASFAKIPAISWERLHDRTDRGYDTKHDTPFSIRRADFHAFSIRPLAAAIVTLPLFTFRTFDQS